MVIDSSRRFSILTMVNCTSKDCSKRNVCIKVVISILVTLGMVFAILAIRSCRWFVFVQGDYSHNRVFQDWTFLPERDMETTTSIGLFRYQNTLINDDDDSLSTTIASTTSAYRVTDNDQCVPYTGFWVGIEHKWKFSSQLCIVLGTIFAFVSLCVIMVGADHFWICTFLLLTTGLQSATIISSLSWCDQYWNCPWLLGALVNLIAACLFLLCWVLAMWGLVGFKVGNPNNNNTDRSIKTDEQPKQKGKEKQKNVDQENNNQSTDKGDSYPSSVLVTNYIKAEKHNENISCSGEEIDVETKDLESAPNMMTLYHFSDQMSHESKTHVFESRSSEDDNESDIKGNELYYDESFDDDTKSTMRRISQSNQTFLDLDAKLKQRQEKTANGTLPHTTLVKGSSPGSVKPIDIFRDTYNAK